MERCTMRPCTSHCSSAGRPCSVPWPNLRAADSRRQCKQPAAWRKRIARARSSDDMPPDWDAEMSIFNKRALAPSQLQVIRRLEEEVDTGKVLAVTEQVAAVEGLNNDAPVGAELMFLSGATGVLLWRHDGNICFVLVAGGSVAVGDSVQCRVAGIFQLMDEAEGPMTKREYATFKVPTGPELVGHVVDFLGRPLSPGAPGQQPQQPPPASSARGPLLGQQLDMQARENVAEALVTGVKAVDILTPIGRGQAMLLAGPPGSGKSELALDILLGQRGSGVQCVYASIGRSSEERQHAVEVLTQHGGLAHTSVIAADAGRPLGEQYAAACAAVAAGERVRDAGGHGLVIINGASCMPELWEHMDSMMASIQPDSPGQTGGQGLVNWEGTMVSAATAQRRKFFSALVQRSAKAHRQTGGGSLTLLLVLPGSPARGEAIGTLAQYKYLSSAQLDKLQAALAMRNSQPRLEGSAGGLKTEVVEEFMSIADGQVVLLPQQVQAGSIGGNVDAQASVSRIGLRAHPPAMQKLGPPVRLELAQAKDALRFGVEGSNAVMASRQRQAALLQAYLAQPAREPVPSEHQVLQLFALQLGFCQGISPDEVQEHLAQLTEAVQQQDEGLMESLQSLKPLDLPERQLLMDRVAAALSACKPRHPAALQPPLLHLN